MLKSSSSPVRGSAVSFLIRAFIFAFDKLFVGCQPDDERDPFYFYRTSLIFVQILKQFICSKFETYLFKIGNLFVQINKSILLLQKEAQVYLSKFQNIFFPTFEIHFFKLLLYNCLWQPGDRRDSTFTDKIRKRLCQNIEMYLYKSRNIFVQSCTNWTHSSSKISVLW